MRINHFETNIAKASLAAIVALGVTSCGYSSSNSESCATADGTIAMPLEDQVIIDKLIANDKTTENEIKDQVTADCSDAGESVATAIGYDGTPKGEAIALKEAREITYTVSETLGLKPDYTADEAYLAQAGMGTIWVNTPAVLNQTPSSSSSSSSSSN